MGHVIKCFPSWQVNPGEPSSKREVIIVNEEKKLIVLTLWDAFDSNEGEALAKIIDTMPLIIAMRVRVTTNYGLSITTTAGSAIMITPPIPEALQHQKWMTSNTLEIMALLHNESFKNINVLLPYPYERDIMPIVTATELMTTGKPTWVRGKLSLPPQETNFTFTGCANCSKPIDADITWIVPCPAYKQDTEIEIMSRVTITLEDRSGAFCVDIRTPQFEKIISMDPVAVEVAQKEYVAQQLIAESIESSTCVAFVHSNACWQQQNSTTKYYVINAYKVPQSNGLHAS